MSQVPSPDPRAPWRERAATPQELAILRHPDRRTGWVVLVTARLGRRTPGLAEQVQARLQELSGRAPILGARWDGGRWRTAAPPAPRCVDGDPRADPTLLAGFDLAREAPIRVLVTRDGDQIALAAHHAALDGRAMVAVIGALLGVAPPAEPAPAGPEPEDHHAHGIARHAMGAARRLAAPADVVAHSASDGRAEVLAIRELAIAPPNITGRIAQAAISAIAAHNAARGRPWRRVGLTVATAGPPGIANLAGYRRLDLPAGADVAAATHTALREPPAAAAVPVTPRSLTFLDGLAARLSDSLLVSNLGRLTLPGVAELALYPVARGRSAIAIGAGSVQAGRTSLTLRARNLTAADADALIGHIQQQLAG